ncbi:hypothetical protein FOXYS1_6852 [Fusarium oxysporum]|uniref:Major facilitator superfamily (MFS) profile domain-containing protein n=1 Tax=Fusarium oxysporum TaxID=5507 RepID=A0A8H5EJ02_FUSOX|nr:hypothetical protein FOXYS1_6852 [Fusarium oxysporum]
MSSSIKPKKVAEEGSIQEIEDYQDTRKPANPLSALSREEVAILVDELVHDHNLQDERDIFLKGALVAQNPVALDQIPELTETERHALIQEAEKKWKHPKMLWLTVITCSVGAAVHGWDQTGSNGATLSFPKQFGIGSNSARDKWLVGLINSAPTIAMFMIGCWFSDPLNNRFGRRTTIFISAIFSFCAVLGSAFSQTWYDLLGCRIVLGTGMGIKASTTSVYAAECSPANIRGALTMTWQLWVAFGIFLGFSANLAVMDFGDITWRLQLGSAMIPAIPLLIIIFFCPESPRWYMKKGRAPEAYASLQKLRFTKIQAARDLFMMHMALESEKKLFSHAGNGLKRFVDLFRVPRLRRANLAASTIMIAQQMCGINIISFYSSSIFVESGISEKKALWASWGFGLTTFLFALPAIYMIDRFGRRSLLLATFPHMAWSLLVSGCSYLISGDGNGRLALIATFIFVFAAFYAVGEGPVCYPYAAEAYPLSHREIGMAWSVVINAGGASVLALTFPYMLVALTPTGAFAFYCGLNVLAFIMIFLWVPETKQLTLEELDSTFSISTTRFIRYQFTETLPYWFERYVLWRRDVTIKPLPLETSAI